MYIQQYTKAAIMSFGACMGRLESIQAGLVLMPDWLSFHRGDRSYFTEVVIS